MPKCHAEIALKICSSPAILRRTNFNVAHQLRNKHQSRRTNHHQQQVFRDRSSVHNITSRRQFWRPPNQMLCQILARNPESRFAQPMATRAHFAILGLRNYRRAIITEAASVMPNAATIRVRQQPTYRAVCSRPVKYLPIPEAPDSARFFSGGQLLAKLPELNNLS